MNRRIILVIACSVLAATATSIGLQQHATAREAHATQVTLTREVATLRQSLASENDDATALEQAIAARKAAIANARSTTTSRPAAKNPGEAKSRLESDRAAQKQAAIAEAIALVRVRRLIRLQTEIRPFFERLGLSLPQWEEFETLSLEQADAGRIAATSAAARGLPPGEANAARIKVNEEIEAKMRTLLGDKAYAQIKEFQASLADPVQNAVRALDRQLMFSRNPLTPDQAHQLQTLLTPRRAELTTSVGIVVSDEILAAAGQILSQPQVSAWRRLRSELDFARKTNDLARAQARQSP